MPKHIANKVRALRVSGARHGAAGVWRAARRWAWERAMIMHVSTRGLTNSSADGYLCARQQLGGRALATASGRGPECATSDVPKTSKLLQLQFPVYVEL